VVLVRHDERNGPGAGRPESVEQDAALGGDYVTSIVDDPLPLYRSVEYDSLDPADPRRLQSMKRTADAWYAEGRPEVIRARLEQELQEQNWLAVWRLRRLSGDLAEAEDWVEMANSIARSHRARVVRVGGYEPLDQTPDPWPAESLDRTNWRGDGPPSPNVPAHLRFSRHDTYFAGRGCNG
jgi:hypothetical protein